MYFLCDDTVFFHMCGEWGSRWGNTERRRFAPDRVQRAVALVVRGSEMRA